MKWILLITALLVQASNVHAMTIKGENAQHIEVDLSQQTFIAVSKPSYFRGYIRSNKFINSVTAYNSAGDPVKQLLNGKSKEMEIFWLVDKADTFQIKFDLDKRDAAKIELSLLSLPLKDNQYLSPKVTKFISPLIEQTANELTEDKIATQKRFWQQVKASGTPLVEYTQNDKAIVTFLYQGKVDNVRILGAPYGGHVQLSQLAESDIWFHSVEVPSDTRLSYRVAPNVPQLRQNKNREQRKAVLATAQLDPLNQQPAFGENTGLFGAASTLTLARAESDQVAQQQGHPKGSVSHFSYQDSPRSEPREIGIYTPNKLYPIENNAPLLVLFDGDSYLNKVPTPLIIDNLIASKRVPPMRVVFFNPPRPSMRGKELTPNKAFADMLANQFMPWLCTTHSICPSSEHTILSGSSYGGLASMYIALQHPQRFGKVLSQSGSFWWEPNKSKHTNPEFNSWMSELVASQPKKDLDIYLTAGLFEVEPKHASILQTNQQLFSTIQSKGYNVHFERVASGHDYFSWRIKLADGLTVLFSH